LYEQAWLEARSPNFIVASTLGEKGTREIVRELEDFRQLIQIFTNAKELHPRVPTLLMVFPGPLRDIDLVDPVAGYFHAGLRANYAVARRIPGEPISYFMQHEYTHFIVHNQSRLIYPAWFDEGFAEVLATVKVREGKFEFGQAEEGRMYRLAAGPTLAGSRLVDEVNTFKLSREDGQSFYAQAWGLVHYLTWGRPGTNFGQQMSAYLVSREGGTPPVPAFEEAFGEDVDKINARVKSYFSGKAKYYKGGLAHPFDATQIVLRPMKPDEVAAEIGHLCMETGHIDKVREYSEAALAINPNSARALVDMADVHKHNKDFEGARPLYEKAIALEPQSDWHHLDFGEYWLDLAEMSSEPAKREELLQQARHEFVLANSLNDKNPETLAIYGNSFVMEGRNPAKGVDTLELAHDLLPSHSRISFMLARAYVAVGRKDEARPLLNAMRAWSHQGGAEAAEKLLAEIDKSVTESVPPKVAGDESPPSKPK
jgi:Flp pilus assembly protein TadD